MEDLHNCKKITLNLKLLWFRFFQQLKKKSKICLWLNQYLQIKIVHKECMRGDKWPSAPTKRAWLLKRWRCVANWTLWNTALHGSCFKSQIKARACTQSLKAGTGESEIESWTNKKDISRNCPGRMMFWMNNKARRVDGKGEGWGFTDEWSRTGASGWRWRAFYLFQRLLLCQQSKELNAYKETRGG